MTQKADEIGSHSERAAAAMGVSPTIACRSKTAKDLSNLQYENDESITVDKKRRVTENNSVIVRQAIRDLFPERKQGPFSQPDIRRNIKTENTGCDASQYIL